MICIVNVGPHSSSPFGVRNYEVRINDDVVCNYEVRINDDVVCTFKHKREDGLTCCLKRASDAVEKAKWKEFCSQIGLLEQEIRP